jgi:hypothetical protein
MARNLRIVAHDAVVPNDAVVRNVAIRHDQAIVSHNRTPSVFGATVYGYKLADGGSVSNNNRCIFFFKL